MKRLLIFLFMIPVPVFSLAGENNGGGVRPIGSLIADAKNSIKDGLKKATDDQLKALGGSRSLQELKSLRDEFLAEARCAHDVPVDTSVKGFESKNGQHSWLYTQYEKCGPIFYTRNAELVSREIPEALSDMERVHRVTTHYLHELAHHLTKVREIKVVDVASDEKNEARAWEYTKLFLPLALNTYDRMLRNKMDEDIKILLENQGADPRVMEKINEGSYTAAIGAIKIFKNIRLQKDKSKITIVILDSDIKTNHSITLNCASSNLRLYCRDTTKGFGERFTRLAFDEKGFLSVNWYEVIRGVTVDYYENYYPDKL